MPLQSTSGAASYDAFGGGAAAKVNYIEDFFQSYLRTGTGASATVTTGLDGSTKETLVWTKSRSAATNHKLTDNVRGATKALSSNTTGAEATDSQGLTAFSATGYTIGTNTDYNNSGATYVDWQWVAQPKFFDVQVFNGHPSSFVTVNHNLGSVPGFIVYKRCSGTPTYDPWWAWHRTFNANDVIYLNTTAAKSSGVGAIADITSTSTTFYDSSGSSSNQYVAYFFAHDAGGFGLTGTDNVISCGSFTATGSAQTVTLGYEPQWVLVKSSSNSSGWYILDNMRGLPVSEQAQRLYANTSGAEGASATLAPTATGFSFSNTSDFANSGYTYIYIAIRRGPMKVPTVGTSVYNTVGGSGANPAYVAGFPVDLALRRYPAAEQGNKFYSRLTGTTYLDSTSTAAEVTDANGKFDYQNAWFSNPDGAGYYSWMWRRAPGFFDEVCYIGTGVARTEAHSLGVVPELIIIKVRGNTYAWRVYCANLADPSRTYLVLNATDAKAGTDNNIWNQTAPTSSVFTVGTPSQVNESTTAFVSYLFATCAGVSKVGSYTGTGTTLQVNCGFTAGARFVLIKRTDSTGDWYVWDSARGIVSGNDPYLLLNSTAAEVTNTDYIDTYSAGFEITSTAPAAINASGGTFIFLAIA